MRSSSFWATGINAHEFRESGKQAGKHQKKEEQTMEQKNPIKSRVDFVLVFSAENANPNGDPGYDNRPRVDPYTGRGLITDVCIKRKIRNRVEMMKELAVGYDIWVRSFASTGVYLRDTVEKYGGDKDKLCAQFFDIRAFGGVLTSDSESEGEGTEVEGRGPKKKGKAAQKKTKVSQIRGPVSIQYAKSIAPIVVEDDEITRVCPTKFDPQKPDKQTEMGRKKRVPFGVYAAKGSISVRLAEGEKGTGFSEEDLNVLKDALKTLFDGDASSARPAGSMIVQKLVFFTHGSKDGDEPVHKTLDRVKVSLKPEFEAKPARAQSMAAYTAIEVDERNLPKSVKVEPLV